MYNPYQGTQYGRPPSVGGFPGQQSAPPSMGPPPGMGAPPGMTSAPGVGPPPGMQQSNSPQPGRPGGLPSNFQPPANINFSAPVIRLGTSAPGKPSTPVTGESQGRREGGRDSISGGPGRPGLGSGQPGIEQQKQAMRDSTMVLIPPTKDEIVRTLFIGGITEGIGGDETIERILSSAGTLRRWSRPVDADGKKCRFGFAEYDDPQSLGTAVEVLKEIEVPTKRKDTKGAATESEAQTHTDRLFVVVDEDTLDYLENYQGSRNEEPSVAQARLDGARSTLANILSDLASPGAGLDRPIETLTDADGDTAMQNGENKEGDEAEVVTIPLTVDDELSEIPAHMRETVAQEIAAFRERSNRRDMERLKREEEIESMERARNSGQSRANRLASPPPQAPSGPARGANGVPVGPRDRATQVPPSGPKGYQGQQIPRDYQKGVTFVNGAGINGATSGWINREEEESDADDDELEERRRASREAELEKQYLDQERRWLNRERSKTAAVEREKARDKEDAVRQAKEKEAVAKRLRDWNDDAEASRKAEEYYVDRSMWIRNRAGFRSREVELDERDRATEEREKARDSEKREQARGMADQFLARQAEEMERSAATAQAAAPKPFKLSLGAAAQKAQQATNPRRTVAEVEGLLEDEEDASGARKRTLIPIKYDSAAEASTLTQEERDEAVRQLAQEIPSDKDGLWRWEVKWDLVDDAVVADKLKPFVEKKIVEYLGVQEQMLVEVVEDHIRKRGGPQDLVEQLEGALDEEAEALVKKLWRMMIFFSECEKRGLSA